MDMPKEKKLTDIHTHLEQYTSEEMEMVLKRADEAGIRWIVTSGLDLESSARAIEIATVHEEVLASVGIHPWIAAESFPDDFHEKIKLLAHKDVTVAIGEVGLDFIDNIFANVTYHDNQELRDAQERAFRKQVELACEVKLPLIMHARGAYSALIPILKEEKAYRVGGVVHNFDEDEKTMAQLLDMGLFLSFGGAITYPDATTLHKIVCDIPLDYTLLETDSPYIPLYLQSSEKNEPANTLQVARKFAQLRKIDTEELISTIYTNFRKLLNIKPNG